MENIRMPLRELIDTAKERLQELQYAPATINAFSRYWRELLEYAEKVQTQYFSVTLGEDYLREVCHIDVAEGTHDPDLPRWKVNPPKRAVYLLVDLQNSGSVLRKVKEKYTPVPDCFMEITEHFYVVCRSRYNGERTIQFKKFTVERFLLHLEQKGVRKIGEMRDTDIMIPVKPSDFTPHIYTDSELKRFFEQADLLPFYPNCPNRGPVASLLFRMLYGCGLRISEALNLTMKDVDLDRGVLAILDSKFGKSRYVPMSLSLTERCQQYAAHIRSEAPADAPFFPAPDGGHYSERAVYTTFRHILEDAGIPHTGRGPRIHDFRHTFSVCCLKKWILSGKDLNAALPVLSAYLGHKGLNGTQKYLRLTADMYPDIVKTVELQFGNVVPGGEAYEES